VAGVVVALPLLHPFAHLVSLLEDEPSRQVADAHTLFNVLSTLLLWPFVNIYSRFIERLYPSRRDDA
jgi:phosphate:Na+ symporter